MSGLKEGDIGTNDVLVLIQKVCMVAFLGVQVAEKYPFIGAKS